MHCCIIHDARCTCRWVEWCNTICAYMCIVVYVCGLIALLKLKKTTKKHHRTRVTSDFNASNVFFRFGMWGAKLFSGCVALTWKCYDNQTLKSAGIVKHWVDVRACVCVCVRIEKWQATRLHAVVMFKSDTKKKNWQIMSVSILFYRQIWVLFNVSCCRNFSVLLTSLLYVYRVRVICCTFSPICYICSHICFDFWNLSVYCILSFLLQVYLLRTKTYASGWKKK